MKEYTQIKRIFSLLIILNLLGSFAIAQTDGIDSDIDHFDIEKKEIKRFVATVWIV